MYTRDGVIQHPERKLEVILSEGETHPKDDKRGSMERNGARGATSGARKIGQHHYRG